MLQAYTVSTHDPTFPNILAMLSNSVMKDLSFIMKWQWESHHLISNHSQPSTRLTTSKYGRCIDRPKMLFEISLPQSLTVVRCQNVTKQFSGTVLVPNYFIERKVHWSCSQLPCKKNWWRLGKCQNLPLNVDMDT